MTPNNNAPHSVHVLVVDDVAGNRAILNRRLSRQGYRCSEAESGMAALDFLREQLPDIILLDYMMPEMSGIDLLEILKADERTQPVPVIMVTARAEGASVDAALRSGAEDYVTKPIDFVALDARIHTVLDRAHVSSEIRAINQALDNRVIMRVLQLAQMQEELQSERLLCSRLQHQVEAQANPLPPCDRECRDGTLAILARIDELLGEMVAMSSIHHAMPGQLLHETSCQIDTIRQNLLTRKSAAA